MVPEDLLFWIAPLSATAFPGQAVLCRRHADAMSVPRGWTLDDRREPMPRLFRPAGVPATRLPAAALPRAKRAAPVGEQLQIDGTGETPRPAAHDLAAAEADASTRAADVDAEPAADDGVEQATPWEPTFDHDNDLDGLLQVNSPLLARAFRGTDRPRS